MGRFFSDKQRKAIFAKQAKAVKIRKTSEGYEVTEDNEAVSFPFLSKQEATKVMKRLKEHRLKGSPLT